MSDHSSVPQARSAQCPGLAIRPLGGLGLGLLAGVLAWGVVQGVHPAFRVPKKFDVPSIGMPAELFAAHRREQDRVDRWHAMLYVGGLGLLAGAALGIGEAIRGRAWLAPPAAALLGALGGALGSALASMVYVDVRTNIGQMDLMHMLGAQLLLAVPLATGIGLGLGLATQSLPITLKTALAGLAAGVLAGVVYPVAISIVLPEASTESLLPEEASSRLLWLGILSGTIGLVIPIAGRQRKTAAPETSDA
jgi:hypothetical protein